MIYFFSFSDRKYYNSLNRIKIEANESNFFDKVAIFNENNLPNFILEYAHQNPRGFGYWLWKPYFLNEIIKKVKENDIIIYCDAGCSINKNGSKRFNEYIELVNSNDYANISFEMKHQLEIKWTKRDLFEFFGCYNSLKGTGQISNCCIILKKNKFTVELVDLWWRTCNTYRNFIDDNPSVFKNDDMFIENRHDQSVFSIIRKEYGTIYLPDDTYDHTSKNPFNPLMPFLATRLKY